MLSSIKEQTGHAFVLKSVSNVFVQPIIMFKLFGANRSPIKSQKLNKQKLFQGI